MTIKITLRRLYYWQLIYFNKAPFYFFPIDRRLLIKVYGNDPLAGLPV